MSIKTTESPQGIAVTTKKIKLLDKITRLTKNVQDAEDAIQSAYLYQLTHKLKRKHFMWKAFNIAKTQHRDHKARFQLWEFGGVEEDTDVVEAKALICESHFENISAKDEYRKLYSSLCDTDRRMLTALLESGGVIVDAAEATGLNKSIFKTLCYRLRQMESLNERR